LGEKLIERLKGHKRIALDTPVLIYHVEGVEPYASLTAALFDWAGREGISLVLSFLIWTEMLVKPIADGKGEAVRRIEGFLREIPLAEWLPLDEAIAREAARIRGIYGLRTPDAIIAATAVVGGATALVTNDREMRKVEGEGIKVFVLEDFVR